MQGYPLARIVIATAMACLIGAPHGSALAGPMPDDRSLLVAAALPPEAMPTARPAVASEPARRVDREAVEPAERSRIVSYLILRGLQGAGPFLGAR
jgi:hypothetical protein